MYHSPTSFHSGNEVDPNDPDTSGSNCRDGGNCCRTPIVPGAGGNYESNAFWESPSDNKYHFFTTEDAGSNYRLTRVSTSKHSFVRRSILRLTTLLPSMFSFAVEILLSNTRY